MANPLDPDKYATGDTEVRTITITGWRAVAFGAIAIIPWVVGVCVLIKALFS